MSDMSKLRELRRQNLELLLASMGGYGAQKQLADRSGIHLTYINGLRLGNREMGEQIARKIEAGLGLDIGWMDARHGHQEEAEAEAETVETRPLGDLLMENQLLRLWQTVPVERQPLVLELLGDIAEAERSRSRAQSLRNQKKQSQAQGQTQNQSHGKNQTQNQVQIGSEIPGEKRNQAQNQSHGRNQTQNQIQL